jgi:formylglycine-generating enzyme required for sulfatase activity
MLSNLRRKRVQRIDIEEWQYYNIKSDVWWKGIGVGYKDTNMIISKQRYSKEKMEQSFDCDLDTTKKSGIIRNYVWSMILCPSGRFSCGIKGSKYNKFKEMKIEKSFLLGETEITQELYEVVMMGENPSDFKDNPKNPVEEVRWYDAILFCNRLSDIYGLDNYYILSDWTQYSVPPNNDMKSYFKVAMNANSKGFRLPTEWEWEYAAKAGTQLLYSGSDDPNEVAWYKDNSDKKTHPVKQKKPNAWGFYDMSGNVQEWCETQDARKDYSFAYAVRGGYFDAPKEHVQSTTRATQNGFNYNKFLGFRVAKYL